MQTKTKMLGINTLISAALCLTLSAAQADVETTQAPNGAKKTTIQVNGRAVFAILFDGTTGTNGFLSASHDLITNTTAMDFAFATLTSDPNIAILIQGAGEIPNSAFTTTATTAHLQLTTLFGINRCEVTVDTGDFNCGPGGPVTFNLTWTQNGFATIHERTKRTETLGPVTINFRGEFDQRTANINGTWDGHVATDMSGNLIDTQNTTAIREITVEPNP